MLLSTGASPLTATMGKRAGMMKLAARAHGPGGAGGGLTAGKKGSMKKRKIQKKVKIQKVAPSTTAAPSAGDAEGDDFFGLAIPVGSALRARKLEKRKKRALSTGGPSSSPASANLSLVERAPAFGDAEKDSLLQSILQGAMRNAADTAPRALAADEHRARCEELKRAQHHKRLLKAQRWANTRKRTLDTEMTT